MRYCGEQFSNDGTISNSIMKALKRAMAAEFSRELGVKVSLGQVRLAKMGFRVAGSAGPTRARISWRLGHSGKADGRSKSKRRTFVPASGTTICHADAAA